MPAKDSKTTRLLQGFGFLLWGLKATLTHRSLFVKSMIVVAINAVVYSGLIWIGWYYLENVTKYLLDFFPESFQAGWVYSIAWFVLAAGWLVLAIFTAIGAGSVITGPILDKLSEETERILTGSVNSPRSSIWSFVYEILVVVGIMFRSVTLCLLATLFLGWIPGLGQLIPFLIGALFVALNFIQPTAIRHGLRLKDRIKMIKRNKLALLGFGGPVSLFPFLLVPILTPALVVGGTRLFVQFAAEDRIPHRLTDTQLTFWRTNSKPHSD